MFGKKYKEQLEMYKEQLETKKENNIRVIEKLNDDKGTAFMEHKCAYNDFEKAFWEGARQGLQYARNLCEYPFYDNYSIVLPKEYKSKNIMKLQDYYDHLLEAKKLEFPYKQGKPYLYIKKVDGSTVSIYFNTNEDLEKAAKELKEAMTIERNGDVVKLNNFVMHGSDVKSFYTYEGHPEPYTDEEITEWAEKHIADKIDNVRVIVE